MNSCFATWGALPGFGGAFCNSSNVFLDGFNFAWGASTIGSANNGRAPVLCANGSVIPCASALPLDMLTFEASTNLKGNQLKWSTMLNRSMNILRLKDLRTDLIGMLVSIPCIDNDGFIPNTYSYLDESPLNGGTYYRIRHIDIEGEETISSTQFVDRSAKEVDLSIFSEPDKGKMYDTICRQPIM